MNHQNSKGVKIKTFTAAFVATIAILGSSNLLAQEIQIEDSSLNLEQTADRILEAADRNIERQVNTKYFIEKLSQKLEDQKKFAANRKKDLAKIKELLKSANGAGSISTNGKQISVEDIDALAKSTLDKLAKVESRSNETKTMLRAINEEANELAESQSQAIKTATEFKTTMDRFRKKLPRELVMFEFAAKKLESQIKFARKMESEDIELYHDDNETPVTPQLQHMATPSSVTKLDSQPAKQFGNLAHELESMAAEFEQQGHHKQAKKLRAKSRELSGSLSKQPN